jgi:molybdenum cofactor biosynthesis protein MoaC
MTRMADVSGKPTTLRTAVAEGFIRVPKEVLKRAASGDTPKGDPLAIGRIAGILGAKRTAELVPLCHPLPVDWVNVALSVETDGIRAVAEVKAIARTGMEMEALTAVACALLSIYDILKPLAENLAIEGIRIVKKTGGKRSGFVGPARDLSCAILVASDSVSGGISKDISGQALKDGAEREGLRVVDFKIVPDEASVIAKTVKRWVKRKVDLILTTGGTGLSPRDVTTEAIRPLLTKEVPGIAEAIRGYGQARTPFAMLSRGIAGFSGKTLIVTLPGSPAGVRDALSVLFPAIAHCLHIAGGGSHEEPTKPRRKRPAR